MTITCDTRQSDLRMKEAALVGEQTLGRAGQLVPSFPSFIDLLDMASSLTNTAPQQRSQPKVSQCRRGGLAHVSRGDHSARRPPLTLRGECRRNCVSVGPNGGQLPVTCSRMAATQGRPCLADCRPFVGVGRTILGALWTRI